MQPLDGRKLFPFGLGMIMFISFFIASCQKQLPLLPSPTITPTSTRVLELSTKIVILVTPTPVGTVGTVLSPIGKTTHNPAEIIKILNEISQKNRAGYSRPGWFHFVVWGVSENPGDSSSVQDEWMHIVDNQGTPLENLTVIRNIDGSEIQRAVTSPDGTVGNLTLLRQGVMSAISTKDEIKPRPMNDRPTAADDTIGDLQRLTDKEAIIYGKLEVINGKQVFEFYLESTHSEPVQDNHSKVTVTGYSEKYIFDLKTGYLMLMESRLLTGKGEWVLQARNEYHVIEMLPELPDTVARDYQQSVDELNSFLKSR